MSRLAGRLSFVGDCSKHETRDKRLLAEMLEHLNETPINKNERIIRKNARRDSDMRKSTLPESEVKSESNRGQFRGNRGRGKGVRGSFGNMRNRNNTERSNDVAKEKAGREHQRVAELEEDLHLEELADVDEILSQIADLNIRGDRSAAQIKRNITHNHELLDSLDDEQWQRICECLLNTAIEQGECDFVVDLFISLLKNEDFCDQMSSSLMSISSTHIMSGDSKPVPMFLATILCAHWPRHLSKAIDTVNLILYTTVCIIKGWIQVVEEDNSQFYSSEGKDPEGSVEEEDPEIINRCAIAICELCETAQRQLWLKWPTITDEIYIAIKPAITHNTNMRGDTKMRLLSTYTSLNTWTKSRSVTTKNSQTQTVRN